MIFSYCINYFDDEEEEQQARGIVFGVSYSDIAKDLIEFYGEKETISMTIKCIAGSYIIECSDDTIKDIEDNYIW